MVFSYIVKEKGGSSYWSEEHEVITIKVCLKSDFRVFEITPQGLRIRYWESDDSLLKMLSDDIDWWGLSLEYDFESKEHHFHLKSGEEVDILEIRVEDPNSQRILSFPKSYLCLNKVVPHVGPDFVDRFLDSPLGCNKDILRTRRVLDRVGIKTHRELLHFNEDELKTTPGIGQKTIKKIRDYKNSINEVIAYFKQ